MNATETRISYDGIDHFVTTWLLILRATSFPGLFPWERGWTRELSSSSGPFLVPFPSCRKSMTVNGMKSWQETTLSKMKDKEPQRLRKILFQLIKFKYLTTHSSSVQIISTKLVRGDWVDIALLPRGGGQPDK